MIIKCIGTVALSLCLVSVLKNVFPSIVPFVITASGVVVLAICFTESREGISYYYRLCTSCGYGDYYKIMLKGVGVAFLSGIACDLCRDCNEAQLANKIEFAAKLEIMIIALPLIEKLIGFSESILMK